MFKLKSAYRFYNPNQAWLKAATAKVEICLSLNHSYRLNVYLYMFFFLRRYKVSAKADFMTLSPISAKYSESPGSSDLLFPEKRQAS